MSRAFGLLLPCRWRRIRRHRVLSILARLPGLRGGLPPIGTPAGPHAAESGVTGTDRASAMATGIGGEHHGTADLEQGLHQTRRQALFWVGDALGGPVGMLDT
ncbi:hypothetical protein [Nocardia carnea]|uniref:Uncharacterized protein n=1 Tax=Nocardia carnea TaxID=37328 RepID=A0ABW7TYA3_9NOCA|nr:hypothetical protein [Nocardia carnea]